MRRKIAGQIARWNDDDFAIREASSAELTRIGMIAEPHQFDDATWISNRLAEILPVQTLAKQRLMELPDAITRLEIIHTFLGQQGLKI